MGHKSTVEVKVFQCSDPKCRYRYVSYYRGGFVDTGCPKCREKAFEQNGTLPKGSESEKPK